MTSTVHSGARRFGAHALVYMVSTLLMRGLSIFLTPLYTRVMSPADFAMVSIANTLTSALTILFGFAFYACIPRLYYDHETEPDRRRFLGSLFIAAIVFPLGFALSGEACGALGLFASIDALPFHPYLRIVLWSSAFSSLATLAPSLYTALEQPRQVSFFNIAVGTMQLVLNIVFVAVMKMGAVGVLYAGLVNAMLSAVLTAILLIRRLDLRFSTTIVRAALVYCAPLVPHLLANWALSVSDRLVLAAYVPPIDLGRYSLAGLVASGVSIVAAGVITPINPAANRQLGDPETAKEVPPLGTYALFATIAVALLGSVNARELISILAPPIYAEAARFVPWVVAGAALQGFYLVLATGTWYSKKTGGIPFVTVASVGINLGLNLWLVPKHGVLVAAVTTAIGYGVSAVLHGLLAHRNHPIPWEYRRWLAMIGAAAIAFTLVRYVALEHVIVSIIVKSTVAILIFVAALPLLGFGGLREIRRLRDRLLRR